MSFRRALLLAAAVGLPALAIAENVPRPKLELALKPYEVRMVDYTFPSGFRVLFQEDHSQPIVSLSMVVDNGSTSDPPGKEGIAHLVEHMWFRSIHQDENGQPLPKVWDLLREMGANLNAYTAEDLTNYMTVAPRDKLVPLLRLESLRMRSAVEGVTSDVLAVEREVVRNELRLNYENGGGDALRYLYEKLFPKGHPYADLGIGTHDSLNAINLSDVQQFVKENYGPQFTTLVVVGDFKLEDSRTFLNEFGIDQLADPKNPKAELALVEPKPRVVGKSPEPPDPAAPVLVKGETVGVTEARAAVDDPIVILGWTTPGGFRPDQPMMQVAAYQLGFAIQQGINRNWDYEKDEVSGVGCYFNGNTGVGTVLCEIDAGSKDPNRLVNDALDGLSIAWTTDPVYRPFQDYISSYAKQQSMASIFQTVDLVSSLFTTRVSESANFIHYTADTQYFSRQFEWLNGINPDDARKFAEKYLNRNRAVAVVIKPLEEGDIKIDNSDSAYRGTRREDMLSTVLTEAQLTPEFIQKAVIPPDLSKLVDKQLPNGMRVVALPYGDGPLVHARLVFRGGTNSDPTGPFAAVAIRFNTSTDALRFAAFDSWDMGPYASEFGISSPAGNLADSAWVLRDRMDNFIPDTNGKLDWAKGRKSDIVSNQDDPEWWASQVQADRVLPDHIYSKNLTHADYDAMLKWGLEVPRAFYARLYRPENATLYIVGNVTPSEIDTAVNTYWAGWKGWGTPPTDGKKLETGYPPATAPMDRKVVIFDKKVASQTQVFYGCQIAPVTPENRAAAEVMGDAISEDLWLALREQTGASYGAYAFTQFLYGSLATLGQGVSVQNDSAALAAKVFLEEGEKALNGKLNSKTIAVVKYARAQQYVQGHQSTEQMLNRLAGILNLGWPVSYFKDYPARLAKVSAADIQALMKPCVGKETITAVGPKDVLVPQFEKSGLPFEVFDWEQAKKDYAVKYGLKSAKEDAKKEAGKK